MALLGNIKKGTLPNLMRALGLRRATATLICEGGPENRATVHLIDGKLHRVTLRDLSGEQALAELFRWKQGYYYLIKGRIEENYEGPGAAGKTTDGRKHILVVDDDAQITTLIERYLEREGFRVSVAFEGKHALDLIANVKPDLVLLDVMMPGMNGLDVARKLRETPETESLPLIIISAVVRELPKAYRQFNWPFLAKPFKPQLLVQMVKDEISRQPVIPDFTVSKFDFDPHVSPELIDLLMTDLTLPPADTIYSKSEALEIRLALGNFSEETVRFFDLFDGVHTLGEIVAQHPLVASKFNFLVIFMATFGLLERVEPASSISTGKTTSLLLTQLAVRDEEPAKVTGPLTLPIPILPQVAPVEVPLDLLTDAETSSLLVDLRARFGPASMCAKLVVFGLVGHYQVLFTNSVRTLARGFQDRLSDQVTFSLPPLPGFEIARLPVATDCGVFLYQLAVDGELPKLIRQVGSDLWAIAYLTDVHNRFELNYTRYLLQTVGESYDYPFIVAVLNGKQEPVDLKATAAQLGVSEDKVILLDVSVPNSILALLRKLIFQA